MELHPAFAKRLSKQRFNWVYPTAFNGGDIGWILTKITTEEELGEDDGYPFRIAGSEDNYQIITSDGSSTELMADLVEAKVLAEKLFMQWRSKTRQEKKKVETFITV